MIQIKKASLKLEEERILTAEAFVKLFQKDENAIESARFIPPKIDGNCITGYVRVKFKPYAKNAPKRYSA